MRRKQGGKGGGNTARVVAVSISAVAYRKLRQLAQLTRNANRSAAVELAIDEAWRRRFSAVGQEGE